MDRISIINRSEGKYTLENINGRQHLVTNMVAIELDSVMNDILYPGNVVTNSVPGLEMLPVPDGHPTMNGESVSAFNPLAINAHSFGGFTRSPKLQGQKVVAELVIDLDVANRSTRGKRIVNRIKSKKPLAVSTGLFAEVSASTGIMGNQKYSRRVDSIKYDHVAVLLDDLPAGKNTYTLNHDTTPKKRRSMLMDNLELDLSNLAVEDRMLLSGLTVNQLLDHVKNAVPLADAKEIVINAGLQINSLDTDTVTDYLANADEFSEFKAKRDADRTATIDFILSNSKMEKGQIVELTTEALQSLANSVAPANKHITNGKSGGADLIMLDDNALEA